MILNELKTYNVLHNKTNNKYTVYDVEVIDCTNSRDGTAVVLYERGGKLFVCEFKEFNNKFTKY